MRWITAAVMLAALTGLSVADEAAAKKLNGSYTVVEVLVKGEPSPKANDVKTFEIKDGMITIKDKDSDREETAKFKVDASKTPAEIDISPAKGKEENTVFGIYQTKETDKGLELTIAFTKNGGPRPKDFKGAGQDETVLKLLRKK